MMSGTGLIVTADGAVVLIALFVIFAIVAIVVGFVQAAKRRQEMETWAGKRGWRFDGRRREYGFYQQYGFDCLVRGEGRRYAFNLIEGEDRGRPIIAFDYHYQTSTTDGKGRRKRRSHYFSAVMVRYPVPLKPLTIRRENLWDKVANFFGRNTINFESAEFSKRFHVQAPDRKWAHDVIHTRTMDRLLKAPRLEIQMRGPWIVAAKGRRMQVGGFEKALRLLGDLLDGFPEYVREELNAPPPVAGPTLKSASTSEGSGPAPPEGRAG